MTRESTNCGLPKVVEQGRLLTYRERLSETRLPRPTCEVPLGAIPAALQQDVSGDGENLELYGMDGETLPDMEALDDLT